MVQQRRQKRNAQTSGARLPAPFQNHTLGMPTMSATRLGPAAVLSHVNTNEDREPAPKRMKTEANTFQELTEPLTQSLVATNQKKTRIIDLPGELRNEIYDHLLTPRHKPLRKFSCVVEKGCYLNSESTFFPEYRHKDYWPLSHSFPCDLLLSNHQIFQEVSALLYSTATRRFVIGGYHAPEPWLYKYWGHRQLACRVEVLVEDRHRSGDELALEFSGFCRSLSICLGTDHRLIKLTIHHDVNGCGGIRAEPRNSLDYLQDLKLIAKKVDEVAIGYLLTVNRKKNTAIYRAIKEAMSEVPTWSFPIKGHEYDN